MEFQRKLRNFLSLLDESEADMRYFAELARANNSSVSSVVKIWRECFYQASRKRKLYFFYALHELLTQTFLSEDQYVKAFADILQDSVTYFCQRMIEVEFIEALEGILKMWEESKIYASEFIEKLKGIIQKRTEALQKEKEEEGKVDLSIVHLIEQGNQSGSLGLILMYLERDEIRERRENVRLTLQGMQAMNKNERSFELTRLQKNLEELRKGMDDQASLMQELGEELEELEDKAKYVEESMERVKRQK